MKDCMQREVRSLPEDELFPHIHIIKNFLPNPFSDPSVARSQRLSYFLNRGVRRIFKRGGQGVGEESAPRLLRQGLGDAAPGKF